MNREMRRLNKRSKRQEYRTLKKQTKNMDDKTNECCGYINSKPLYSGDCVFLKRDIEIEGQYDWQLNNLIEKNHRFVILQHFGAKKGVVAIGLLSTSSYLNEENKLGIRLNGKYHNNKYVYMDTKTCWIIDVNCIKSKEYSLTFDDLDRCLLVRMNSRLSNVDVVKGLLDNKNVNNNYEKFKELINEKLDIRGQLVLDFLNIQDYINNLSFTEIIDKLNDITSKNEDLIPSAIIVFNTLFKDHVYNQEDTYKYLLMSALILTDHLNITQISSYLQNGY